MKFLLDENITPKVGEFLREYGHDVKTIITLRLFGLKDEEVLGLAYKEGRALITINGKHYVILVPPNHKRIYEKHYGIIWTKIQITVRNSCELSRKIDELCKFNKNIENTIFIIKQDNLGDIIYEQYYPRKINHKQVYAKYFQA
ncbi:MAG TPA: DUF5615 family PIN-like protein [Thermoanaerobacterium sp.]|nr:DUF5615 family PIN-like protein [Thermoanaerobacterium sp.]